MFRPTSGHRQVKNLTLKILRNVSSSVCFNNNNNNNNVIKKEAEKILKYKDLDNRNTAHVECKNKGDTSNNRGDRGYFEVI